MSDSHRVRAPARAIGKDTPNPFAEFLNPNSMMTPGAAGAFTMVITNTLCQQFDSLPLNYTGLAVSLMFGTLVFGYGASLARKMMYFFINSLIIFVVAMGSSAIGARVSNSSSEAKTASLESVAQPHVKVGTFNLASAEKAVTGAKSPPTLPPPKSKPKFFRRWL